MSSCAGFRIARGWPVKTAALSKTLESTTTLTGTMELEKPCIKYEDCKLVEPFEGMTTYITCRPRFSM
jgi:hypothetical protein